MNTSNLFSLNWNDLGKGLLVAVGGSIVAVIEKTVALGSLTFDWQQIGLTALAAGIAYLGKNFFTPAQTVTPAK